MRSTFLIFKIVCLFSFSVFAADGLDLHQLPEASRASDSYNYNYLRSTPLVRHTGLVKEILDEVGRLRIKINLTSAGGGRGFLASDLNHLKSLYQRVSPAVRAANVELFKNLDRDLEILNANTVLETEMNGNRAFKANQSSAALQNFELAVKNAKVGTFGDAIALGTGPDAPLIKILGDKAYFVGKNGELLERVPPAIVRAHFDVNINGRYIFKEMARAKGVAGIAAAAILGSALNAAMVGDANAAGSLDSQTSASKAAPKAVAQPIQKQNVGMAK